MRCLLEQTGISVRREDLEVSRSDSGPGGEGFDFVVARPDALHPVGPYPPAPVEAVLDKFAWLTVGGVQAEPLAEELAQRVKTAFHAAEERLRKQGVDPGEDTDEEKPNASEGPLGSWLVQESVHLAVNNGAPPSSDREQATAR